MVSNALSRERKDIGSADDHNKDFLSKAVQQMSAKMSLNIISLPRPDPSTYQKLFDDCQADHFFQELITNPETPFTKKNFPLY